MLKAKQDAESKRLIDDIRLQEEEKANAELVKRKERARLRMIEKAQQKRKEQEEMEKRKIEIEKLAQKKEEERLEHEERRLAKARRHRKKKEKHHQKEFIEACKRIVDAEQQLLDEKKKRRKEAQAWMERKNEAIHKLKQFDSKRAPLNVLVSQLSLKSPRSKVHIDRGVLKSSRGSQRPRSSSALCSPPMKNIPGSSPRSLTSPRGGSCF